jgi:hypothetical protein
MLWVQSLGAFRGMGEAQHYQILGLRQEPPFSRRMAYSSRRNLCQEQALDTILPTKGSLPRAMLNPLDTLVPREQIALSKENCSKQKKVEGATAALTVWPPPHTATHTHTQRERERDREREGEPRADRCLRSATAGHHTKTMSREYSPPQSRGRSCKPPSWGRIRRRRSGGDPSPPC